MMVNKKCLIVVDMQNDFVNPKGTMYIKDSEKLIPLIKEKILEFKKNNDYVVFTKDWHVKDHISFKQWGEHCLQNEWGAEFVIDEDLANLVIYKGIFLESDSYSGFYVGENTESELKNFLIKNKVQELLICGVAKNVCVQATYDDAKKFNFKSSIIDNLTKEI